MQRRASVMGAIALSIFGSAIACTEGDAARPVGTPLSEPGEAGSPGDATMATGNGADGAGDAPVSSDPCAGVTGSMVAADWSFAVSMASLNGDKGQLLTVKRCDSVVWTNTDTSTTHSVVSTDGGFAFHTPANAGGAYPAIQFPMAGTFTYDCGFHGSMMIGQITVQ
jgi:plastocyanin